MAVGFFFEFVLFLSVDRIFELCYNLDIKAEMLIKEDKNMPTGENVNNDNPKTEIKYVTKDEFMEKLRKSKRSANR